MVVVRLGIGSIELDEIESDIGITFMSGVIVCSSVCACSVKRIQGNGFKKLVFYFNPAKVSIESMVCSTMWDSTPQPRSRTEPCNCGSLVSKLERD